MIAIVIVILNLIIMFLWLQFLIDKNTRKENEARIKALSSDLDYQKEIAEKYKSIIRKLEPKISPEETIEIARYAMVKSHPDNGGKAEDFIKFKKCYEALTNK